MAKSKVARWQQTAVVVFRRLELVGEFHKIELEREHAEIRLQVRRLKAMKGERNANICESKTDIGATKGRVGNSPTQQVEKGRYLEARQ